MRRRNVLKGMMAFAALQGLPLAGPSALAAARDLTQRVRPGRAGWPDAAQWRALSAAVGGNLMEVSPLLAACTADAHGSACQETLKNLRNPFYIGDQVGGTQVSGWLDAWTPAPSAYAVRGPPCGRRGGGGEFRARPPAAAGREGYGPLLPRHLECSGLAAYLDATNA